MLAITFDCKEAITLKQIGTMQDCFNLRLVTTIRKATPSTVPFLACDTVPTSRLPYLINRLEDQSVDLVGDIAREVIAQNLREDLKIFRNRQTERTEIRDP